jgi:hypothetical protein
MPSRSGRNNSKSSSRSASSRSKTGSRGSSKVSARSSASSRSRSASGRSKNVSGSSRATSGRSRTTERGTASSRRAPSRASSASSRPLTDHEEIRQWAEERGASPACVRGTGGGEDVGMIRLDFPGFSGEQSLEPIEWDEWFQKFDERGLALLVQDETTRGQKSNFNKLVSRETAASGSRSRGAGSASRKKSSGGRGASSRRKAA